MDLKIIVERNIPFIEGRLEPCATVEYLAPEEITPQAMRHADALVTRTRTRVDEALLVGSKCSLVASATIGLDHVDIPWCEAHGVTVANAPGCNAPAVAQYVLSSLLRIFGNADFTLGIVGCGNVGKVVKRWAEGLGIRVMVCDPPRAEVEGSEGFVDMETLAREADAITFHTPLTHTGSHPTYHLANDKWLSALERKPVVVNSARGGVVDNKALVKAIENGKVSHAVIDCWEGEPKIMPELLKLCTYATPHIAGYSREGKIRASAMAVDAVARHFGITAAPPSVTAPEAPATVRATELLESYDPMADTKALKAAPEEFENLRNHYALRHEPRAL